MKLIEIRCDQFAGLSDRDYHFTEGLNLLIGANESGKSTLVDLIYSLFFRQSHLDRRSDREFRERFFPRTVGSYQGDTIDGTVRFETDKGTYKLSKEWSSDNDSCRLTMPDGSVIRDPATVNAVLTDVMGYGRGIYDELVFASRKKDRSLLRSLLGSGSSEGTEELASVITRTVMETGGIDLDAMERELRETVDLYEGRWDFETDMPQGGIKRGIRNKWKQGAGLILDAYYQMEEAASELREVEGLEKNIEDLGTEITRCKELLLEQKSKRERFSKVMSLISQQNTSRKLLEAIRRELRQMRDAREDWPEKILALKEAVRLTETFGKIELKERYIQAKSLTEEHLEIISSLNELGDIKDEDVRYAEELSGQITSFEVKLKGINVSARIRKLSDTDISVRSLLSGDVPGQRGDAYALTEATEILIPQIAEILLTPADTDSDEIRAELSDRREKLISLLGRYGVSSSGELREKQSKMRDLIRDSDILTEKIRHILGVQSWDELKEKALPFMDEDLPEEETIRRELSLLCGGKSPEAFTGSISAVIGGYTEDYGDQDTLCRLIKEKELQETEQKAITDNSENIPEEFLTVEDPGKYDGILKSDAEKTENEIDNLRQQLSSACAELGNQSSEECSDRLEKARKLFSDTKEEYFRWKHILEVFSAVRRNSERDPMKDIQENFGRYLSQITNGRISVESMDRTLSSSISSGRSVLSDVILSEGSRDTIVLAFRLAMLEHLFPEGGCVVVFDDPFTDMDPDRTRIACGLLESFSEKNQVIFVSCDDKYCELMNGTVIRVEA